MLSIFAAEGYYGTTSEENVKEKEILALERRLFLETGSKLIIVFPLTQLPSDVVE